MTNSENASLVQHLSELRNRLIKIIIALILSFIGCWIFAETILEFIRGPIAPYLTSTDGKLIFTNPIEKFMSYIKVSFFAAIVASCPYWLFQSWKFVSPGLYKDEKKWSLVFVFFSSLLFILGNAFVYFVVFPQAFHFLIQFGGGGELPYIALKDYISFFIRTCLVFGFVFQTPLVLSFLIKLKILPVEKLKAFRPYALVFVAALSAFITPPDILSMFFVMLPLYLFFEISLWIGAKI